MGKNVNKASFLRGDKKTRLKWCEILHHPLLGARSLPLLESHPRRCFGTSRGGQGRQNFTPNSAPVAMETSHRLPPRFNLADQ